MKKASRPFNEDNWPKPDTTGGEPWPRTAEVIHAQTPRIPPAQEALESVWLAPGIPTPDRKSPTWPFVFAFACAMEYKLSLNRRKGDSAGWRKDGSAALIDRLDDEVEELTAALGQYYSAFPGTLKQHRLAVLLEAADVANFCLMIADCIQHET